MNTNPAKSSLLYLYPPRPKLSITHSELPKYEATGNYKIQYKYQGSRCVCTVHNNEVQVWTRHAEPFKNIIITQDIKNLFLNLNLDKSSTYAFDGEFIHNKAKSKITNAQALSNVICLFDILYYKNNLYKMLQTDRLALLDSILGNPKIYEPKKRAFQVTNSGNANLWMAETFENDFSFRYYYYADRDCDGNQVNPEIEGVVLRRKKGLLGLGNSAYTTSEILRCRYKSGRAAF